jgi:hypothetical protein
MSTANTPNAGESVPCPSDATGELPTGDAEMAAILSAIAAPPAPTLELAERVRLPAVLAPAQAGLAERLREAAQSSDAVALRAGSVLDEHYRLEYELGRGGMGVVWAATNLRTGKLVAIKQIARDRTLSASQAQLASQRLRREARAAASIRHENVVDLHDVGGSDEAPFLVMELLEGESLRSRMARGRMHWDEALAILLPISSGIAAAHAAGVVHRDLKPDNLFLCGAPQGPIKPKVLDFGVAAMHDVAPDGPAFSTRTGAILGTPTYMSLEQLTGRGVDARTDVYALGVVLYELVTGSLPFRTRNASELAIALATQQPEPPTKHVPALRGRREAVLLRALARTPEERFESVGAFAQALREADAQPPGRPWKAWVVGLACAALLVAAGAFYARGWRPARASRAPTAGKATPAPVVEAPAPVLPMPAAAQPEPTAHVPAVEAPARPPVARSPKPRAKPSSARPAPGDEQPAPESTELKADEF